jgi:hypothetical protein
VRAALGQKDRCGHNLGLALRPAPKKQELDGSAFTDFAYFHIDQSGETDTSATQDDLECNKQAHVSPFDGERSATGPKRTSFPDSAAFADLELV